MNTQVESSHSENLRAIIKQARASKGMTERDVNDEYYRQMAARDLTAPRAIMTQVRDRRREFMLNKKEAQCMALTLGLNPEQLYPPESPQPDLLPEEDPVFEQNQSAKADQPQSPQPSESKTVAESPTPEKPAATPSKKVSIGFYDTPRGLQFLLNMELTQIQLERLTLAIPVYMMRLEDRGEKVHAQAQVTIFPYQAEMITRAIYGVVK